MLISKSNRFHVFVVAYASLFALLAFFGGIEASHYRDRQEAMSQETAARVAAVTRNQAYYKMPRMDVTLSGTVGQHHVRLGITLQMDKNSIARFAYFQPRVSDRILNFLDHENIDDFRGEFGMVNLRNSILFEANQVSGPVTVSDVLFREFVIR